MTVRIKNIYGGAVSVGSYTIAAGEAIRMSKEDARKAKNAIEVLSKQGILLVTEDKRAIAEEKAERNRRENPWENRIKEMMDEE